MTTNAPRTAIDFDAFERDLRQASLPQPESPSRADPLAELARIVGQDDPFRALLASQGAQPANRPSVGSQGSRVEPAFYDAPSAHHGAAPATHSPADAFDQYLASVEQHSYSDEEGAGPDDSAAFESGARSRGFVGGRPRAQLLQVGAAVGVLVLCVTGALGWKAMHGTGSSGGPVTVLADKTPLKVAPQAADGVEIPDQNKQIYERGAKDGQIKVVNREEQPIDVAQAVRSTGRDGAAGSTTPGNTALLTDSLGEPRRVRTVSVKPDTPVTPASQAQSQPQRVASADGAVPASPIPTMTMPDASPAGASSQTPTESPRRPQRTLASTPVPAKPVQTADASGAAQPIPASASPEEAPPAPAPRKAAQRVASIAPETTASTDAAPAAAPAATESVGGFSVQIGVRASESDAHSAFRQMQGKFSQLSGKPELIQQAEVGGKSIYRVRVGPLAKNDATSLCTELKGAGGQCFVAKN